MSALVFALLLLGQDADPLSHPVPADPYQMPIISAHVQCVTEGHLSLPADPGERRTRIDAAIASCRATMESALDRGAFSSGNRPLTRHQRRATGIVLDGTEAQIRASLMNVEPLTDRYAGLARPGVELSDRPADGAPGGVVVLDPIAPFWSQYSRCVIAHMNAGGPRDSSRVVHRAIDQCRADRETLMAQSDTALAEAPDYQDPARRRDAIRSAFDGFDTMMLDLPRLRATGQLPGQHPSPRNRDAQN
jgi:hypothetical protein